MAFLLSIVYFDIFFKRKTPTAARPARIARLLRLAKYFGQAKRSWRGRLGDRE